jgi:hypothetical protein
MPLSLLSCDRGKGWRDSIVLDIWSGGVSDSFLKESVNDCFNDRSVEHV